MMFVLKKICSGFDGYESWIFTRVPHCCFMPVQCKETFLRTMIQECREFHAGLIWFFFVLLEHQIQL